MDGGLRDRFRSLVRRAGVGEVSPLAVGAAGLAFGAAIAIAAWVWLPRGATGVTYASHGDDARSSASRGASATSGFADTAEQGGVAPALAATQGAACVVHVVGAVRQPGVYELRAGQRVTDAVAAAGGFRRDAAQDAVNQAQLLQDGEQIAIPTVEDVKAGTAPGAGAGSGSGAGGAQGTAGGRPGGTPVDLNSADAAALDALPGIGPATAAKIVADRAANGSFKSVDDLGRVPGIGPKKLEQLKGLIRVR